MSYASNSYPEKVNHIKKQLGELAKSAPETMHGFGALHKAATADGTLNKKTRELIALAISVATRCDDCIAFHTQDALKAGANEQEVIEALEVAVLMGGGPAAMYATHALDAFAAFSQGEN